ncbi:CapA family protein [Salininema proteolyticum]|uniref:CapA family protein n=1 Tax=Salininema proteolyticum TaxID=1607685 RepID=A0ABV8TVC6_9ACTN
MRTSPASRLARRSVLTAAGAGLVLSACGNDEDEGGSGADDTAPPRPEESSPEPQAETVTITYVGDAFPGKHPDRMPPDDDFFADVKHLFNGDIDVANLEGALSTDEWSKCESGCVYFTLPSEYASLYADAGFEVLNHANNHAWDAGPDGAAETREAVEGLGMHLAGHKDTITTVEANGITVAFVGFAGYAMFTDLRDPAACAALVAEAKSSADLVVASAHIGAEGVDARHVTAGMETFAGERRGDPIALSRACIDAGADLYIGHGPHVMRGMEVYNGKLVAHSLGNFGGGQGILDNSGWLGVGGVLSVTLAKDGTVKSAGFASTLMDERGYPVPDEEHRGLDAINELASDFGPDAVTAAPDGSLLLP